MSNIIYEENWSFEYNNLPGLFTFRYGNDEVLLSSGVELGILQEKYGFEKKCRLHQSEKSNSYRIETETKHPFGAEPVIKHKYEQCTNHIRVTTDIQISHQLPMENIIIDKLLIPGEWKSVEAFVIKEKELDEVKKIRLDLSEGKQFAFESIPLILLFENEKGIQLEIGCGYDLWRWDIATKFEAELECTLERTEDGFIYKRGVAVWQEEYNMERRNFRFSWYFAWLNKNERKEIVYNNSELIKLVYKNNKFESENTLINNSDFYYDDKNIPVKMKKNNGIDICYCSSSFNNTFKHWLRSLYHIYLDNEHTIKVFGLKPGICNDSSHVSSKSKNTQIHFDYLYLIGIYEWAKQYLGHSNVSLQLYLDKGSIYKDLPSAIGISL